MWITVNSMSVQKDSVRVRLLEKTASLKTMMSFYPSPEEHHFIRTKYSQLRQVQSRIDATLRHLTSAHHSSSSSSHSTHSQQEQQEDLDQPSQAIRAHREQLVKQAEVLRKPSNFRVHSLPRHNQTIMRTALPEKRSLSRRKVSLLSQDPAPRPSKIYPILLSRANRDREPANASRNSEVQPVNKPSPEDETAYEYVREERRKGEQLSRLAILGKIMGENYRKGLKDLEVRRKIFKSIKVH